MIETLIWVYCTGVVIAAVVGSFGQGAGFWDFSDDDYQRQNFYVSMAAVGAALWPVMLVFAAIWAALWSIKCLGEYVVRRFL
jgi:hypothetical protein